MCLNITDSFALASCSKESNFVDNYYIVRKEIQNYKKNLTDKIEIIALSKFDLSKSNHKDLIKIVKKTTGKTPIIFSSITKNGIDDLISELFVQCSK